MTISLLAVLIVTDWIVQAIGNLACLLALAIMIWRSTTIRGTTVIAPWMWLALSLVALQITLLLSPAVDSTPDRLAVRLLVAALTLCPGVALLGAKRPQDKAWQFIVLSLWIVLTLPALQSLVGLNRGLLQLHWAHSWFLLALLLFTVMNSLFTSMWPAVVLMGIGQAILLAPFLPFPFKLLSSVVVDWGIVAYASAVPLGLASIHRRRKSESGINRLWRDFRDAFGLAWAVRVADRIESAAKANGWNVAADWRAIRASNGKDVSEALTPDEFRAFQQNLRNLLRRFVSEDWIDRRLEP